MAARAIKITLPALHSAQREIIRHDARFRVAACGRRFGKTQGAAAEAVYTAARKKRVWWVAPTYDVTRRGWRSVMHLSKRIPGVEVRRGDREVIYPCGGFIAFKTASTGASLLGEGLDLLVVDEAALVPEEAWIQDLRPALSDRLGRALFLSTPRGQNWFWRAYARGQDPAQTDWQSWCMPTSANPYIAPSEIESARDLMPKRTFEQEYLAQFLADGGAVFRNLSACTLDANGAKRFYEPQENHEYIFGVDWGKDNDFTCIAVFDKTARELVHMERFNQIRYKLQRGRLEAQYEIWKPSVIWVEENSIGVPNLEELQDNGLPARGFLTTGQSKTPLIESLALAFEKEEVHIVNDPVVISELQAYTMRRLPSGRFAYDAPSGMHDDTVIALALAWHGYHYGSIGISFS